jgi:hypothetical protein
MKCFNINKITSFGALNIVTYEIDYIGTKIFTLETHTRNQHSMKDYAFFLLILWRLEYILQICPSLL